LIASLPVEVRLSRDFVDALSLEPGS